MNTLMNLPTGILEMLDSDDMLLVIGGDAKEPVNNNGGEKCTGQNNGGTVCNGANNGGITCG